MPVTTLVDDRVAQVSELAKIVGDVAHGRVDCDGAVDEHVEPLAGTRAHPGAQQSFDSAERGEEPPAGGFWRRGSAARAGFGRGRAGPAPAAG